MRSRLVRQIFERGCESLRPLFFLTRSRRNTDHDLSRLRSTPTLLNYHRHFLQSTITLTSISLLPITSRFVNSSNRRVRRRQQRPQQLPVIDLELRCRSRRRRSKELVTVSRLVSLYPAPARDARLIPFSSRSLQLRILGRPVSNSSDASKSTGSGRDDGGYVEDGCESTSELARGSCRSSLLETRVEPI